jgi:hypothetical protein
MRWPMWVKRTSSMPNDCNEERVEQLIRAELLYLGYGPGAKVSKGDLLTAKLRACHSLLVGACENDMNKPQ